MALASRSRLLRPSHNLRLGLALAALALPFASPASAQTVTIGADRILRVNGTPFFPVGLLELGRDRFPTDWNDRIRSSGANCVWDNGFAYCDTIPSCEAIRDSSIAANYWLLTGSPDTWNWDNASTPEPEVSKPMYAPDTLAVLDQCFPSSSRHLGYANRDEPEWVIPRQVVGDIDSAHVHETYAQLKAREPSKIVAMNFGNANLSGDLATWKTHIAGFLPATDIVMSANYPYPAGPGTCGQYNVFGPSCSMDRLWWAADIYRTELAPNKPLWMILQGHKGIPLKEARWTATQSIIHGATGLLWAGWTWFHPEGDGIANWPVIRKVVSEYAALHSVLVQPLVNNVVSQTTDVVVLGKRDPTHETIVFAASRNGYTGPGTIKLPPNTHGSWVKVLYEDRYVPIQSKRFTDFFDGYESHIYQVMPPSFDPPGPPVSVPLVGAPAGEVRLEVFPNPVTQRPVTARLTAPSVEGATCAVHDVSGRRVGEATLRAATRHEAIVTWDAAEGAAPPGVYFLRARTAGGAATTARVVLR